MSMSSSMELATMESIISAYVVSNSSINHTPEAMLPKDVGWIKLQKPRKSYEDTIRTILITIHFLNHVKKNPDISAKSMWDNLSKNKEFRLLRKHAIGS
ncbi:hypothetical protein SESBI_16423 [Sesbania bispinosa]|nr:hypothetical protein SESBI_16423 [Sesbania bispinosa]